MGMLRACPRPISGDVWAWHLAHCLGWSQFEELDEDDPLELPLLELLPLLEPLELLDPLDPPVRG